MPHHTKRVFISLSGKWSTNVKKMTPYTESTIEQYDKEMIYIWWEIHIIAHSA